MYSSPSPTPMEVQISDVVIAAPTMRRDPGTPGALGLLVEPVKISDGGVQLPMGDARVGQDIALPVIFASHGGQQSPEQVGKPNAKIEKLEKIKIIEQQFIDAVGKRRVTWIFDWIISLFTNERKLNKTGGNNFRPESTVRGLKKELELLETKQPAWVFVNSLASAAATLPKEEAKGLVQRNVKWLLQQLYDDINAMERWVCTGQAEKPEHLRALDMVLDTIQLALRDPSVPSQRGGETIDRNALTRTLKGLYGINGGNGCRLVGPVGERPIHVCFLLACAQQAAKTPHGEAISNGIVRGVREFLSEKAKGDPTDEGMVGYGKDYCAALASTRMSQKPTGDISSKWPYLGVVDAWVQTMLSKVKESVVPPDFEALITTGLYEGETILYFAITSKNVDFVKFYLDRYGVICALTPAPGLFFRPRRQQHTLSFGQSHQFLSRLTGSELLNEDSASEEAYFGSCAVFFAASQGSAQESTKVMDILVDAMVQHIAGPASQNQNAESQTFPDRSTSQDSTKILAQQAAINIRDTLGNTLLHFAAWNGSIKIFKWLVSNGADMNITNNDGLSPLTLTARFGLWETFNTIRDICYKQPLWHFGFVTCTRKDLSHIDSTRNIQETKKFLRSFEVRASLVVKLAQQSATYGQSGEDELTNPHLRSLYGNDPLQTMHPEETVRFFVRKCREYMRVKELRLALETTYFPKAAQADHLLVPFVSTLEIIKVFRPKGWISAVKDCIDDLVLKKWHKCYKLVFIGQTVVPFIINFALFGTAWQHRKISIRENSGMAGWYAPPNHDLEAECGWKGIRESVSGRVQVVLLFYGALSLVALARRQLQSDLRDIDPDGRGMWLKFHYSSFLYQNFESLICSVTGAMFISMGAARIAAGEGCTNSFAMTVEKNTMAIAGLFLFVNVINVLKPMKVFGQLFLIIYKMIAKDLLNFVIVYMSLFLAFLVAIQAIQGAENYYLNAVTSDAIYNGTKDSRRKGGSSSLGVDTQLCQDRIMSSSDTAYKMFTTSLGDGFGDILQMSRSKPDANCGGYTASFLLAVLWTTWVVLTNILELNLLITLLNNTMTQESEKSEEKWYRDIIARVISYERRFPELRKRAHRPSGAGGFMSWIFDVGLILYCVPEVHLFAQIFQLTAQMQSQPREPTFQVANLFLSFEDARIKSQDNLKRLRESNKIETERLLITEEEMKKLKAENIANKLQRFLDLIHSLDHGSSGAMKSEIKQKILAFEKEIMPNYSKEGGTADRHQQNMADFLLWVLTHDLSRLDGSVRLSNKVGVESDGKGQDKRSGEEPYKISKDDNEEED